MQTLQGGERLSTLALGELSTGHASPWLYKLVTQISPTLIAVDYKKCKSHLYDELLSPLSPQLPNSQNCYVSVLLEAPLSGLDENTQQHLLMINTNRPWKTDFAGRSAIKFLLNKAERDLTQFLGSWAIHSCIATTLSSPIPHLTLSPGA